MFVYFSGLVNRVKCGNSVITRRHHTLKKSLKKVVDMGLSVGGGGGYDTIKMLGWGGGGQGQACCGGGGGYCMERPHFKIII